jgi:hypothetical protein
MAESMRKDHDFADTIDDAWPAAFDGVATFPLVGVGKKLQFRAMWEELSSPLEGELDGPERAGDVVKFEAASKAAIPAFLARLVDEDHRPVSSRKLTTFVH